MNSLSETETAISNTNKEQHTHTPSLSGL